MKKYRILIADDDIKEGTEERKESLEKYFTNDWIRQTENMPNKDEVLRHLPTEFEVVFCATMDEFEENIKTKEIHAFFIDYQLRDPDRTPEIGDFKEESFKEILYQIKGTYGEAPIYVYSSKWNDELMYELLEKYSKVFPNKTPNNFLTFKYFESMIKDCKLNQAKLRSSQIDKVEAARKQIWNTIAVQRNHVAFQPSSPTGDIVILQISDLQFGDWGTSKNVAGIWNDMEYAISNYLREKSLEKVDIVVITGDVAMSGKKEEYREAAVELNKFLSRLWKKEMASIKDRIIVVPGNHDFDINACVLDYFTAENKEGERVIDFDSVIKQIESNKGVEQLNNYQRLGLQAFREFAYELTQDDTYILSENLDFIINKFNNWGLRFICLNSVCKINAKKTNYASVETESIKEICNSIDSKEDFLTIVLVHHTLMCSSTLQEKEASNIKQAFTDLQRTADAQIVMGGHRHKNDTAENDNSARKTLQTIEAASLRVEAESEEYFRGFGVLTIKNDFKKADLQYFSFNKADGEIKKEQSYSYDLYK